MSKGLFISKVLFLSFLLLFWSLPETAAGAAKGGSIIITSQTLTADSSSNTALFEGLVVAKTDDISMYSDRMEVAYDSSRGKVMKIHASGDVKVQKMERAIFSKEATYFGEEEKIVFTGEPKAVDGENVITGTRIIFFLRDDRTVVEGSRVFLKKTQKE